MFSNAKVSKINRICTQDLKQELLLTIYKVLLKFKLDKELISKNLKLIEIKSIYDTVISHKYYDSFKLKYQYNISGYTSNKDDLVKVINEFYLFCCENKFKKYMKLALNRKVIDFIRKYKINFETKIISLNSVTENDEEELLYKIIDKSSLINYQKNDYSLLSTKDIEFLDLFYVDNKKLTEKEVAKILGVSQQAVSKRLNKIKNKLKKF
jgi:RNA polymerase sigma factor (sigma-70 family)